MKRIGVLVLAGLGVLGACGPPLPRRLGSVFHESPELIPYRALKREDFKASMTTGLTRAEEEQIEAMICTQIIVRPREVVTRAVRSTDGATLYVASLDDPLFFAAMNRTCSWWKPDGVLSEEHLLEHEQIHFAIAELEARRLNSRADDIARRIHTEGSDLATVSQRAQGELRAILNEADEATLDRSTLFDIRARDRVKQRQWFHKVTAELEATHAYARGPQTLISVEIASGPAAPKSTAPAPGPTPVSASPVAPPASDPTQSSSPVPSPVTPPPTSPASSASFPE